MIYNGLNPNTAFHEEKDFSLAKMEKGNSPILAVGGRKQKGLVAPCSTGRG